MSEASQADLLNQILGQKSMNLLFLHRSFPAQYRHVLIELMKNPLNMLLFATNNSDAPDMPGVTRLVYPIAQRSKEFCHGYLQIFEEAVLHAQGAANMAYSLKKRGIKPDVICGHSWGPPMFMKDIYPDVPLLCYFEWFNNAHGADLDFGREINEDQMAHARCHNSVLLSDLESCDMGICPTEWQKQQFPKEFHHKIKVLHDGVNLDYCKPDENAVFEIQNGDKYYKFTAKDEIVTFTTRGMEPYRGFPQFMEAVAILQEKRPNTHFIIAGEDVVCYGDLPPEGSYRQQMLKKHKYNEDRVHFVGTLPVTKYMNLLQITSAHVYLTVPFVLSWSILEAMGCAAPIVASKTPPVLEVVQDGYNGILFDFFDVEEQVAKIEYALDNRDRMLPLRQNARNTIVEKYDSKKLLPQHVELIRSLIK